MVAVLIAGAGLLSFLGAVFYPQPTYTVDVRLQSDGVFTSRNLGTLFESSDGQTVCRAGFANGAQTRGKISQKHLEFTCGPVRALDGVSEVFDAGKPTAGSTRSEVRSLRDGVVDVSAHSSLVDGKWRPYAFEDVEHAVDQSEMYVQAVQLIDGELLTFPHGVGLVLYGEKTVLDFSCGSSLRNGIYYDGRIYVSHFDALTKRAWITHCDWTSEEETCLNTKTIDWPYWNDVYGMLGWQGALYMSTGADHEGKGAGIWRFTPDSNELVRVFPSDDRFSGEFYGMLVVYDSLIVGHYPSGYVARISGDGKGAFLNVPAPLSDTYGKAVGQALYREAQSLDLYAGRVWIGMYPWGFLWEGTPSLENWRRHRLFTWPAIDPSEATPFHNELNARYLLMSASQRTAMGARALPSFWGKRIHSVALSGDENSVLYGLGNMPGLPYEPVRDSSFGTVENFQEYGSVRGLRAPNTIVKYVPWPKDGELNLKFSITCREMILSFEGQEVERIPAKLCGPDFAEMKLLSVGHGLYGSSEYKVDAKD